ncbi:MAG: tRNA pseudouridine(38-40) synthase TruA [Bacteroidota bacterium]
MKTRYFIFIAYKGTSYHGWQLQPNSVTVQKILENALTTILNEKTDTTGAGRTDAGVHARVFCAHFESPSSELAGNMKLITRLNRYLPKDISVSGIRKVLPDAHARFSAVSRTYRYYITTAKDPFTEESAWFIQIPPDIAAMNKGCSILLKHKDFTSFSKLHSDVRTNECRIIKAEWVQDNNMFIFTIKADRFLRNMVKALVGTMVELGRKKIGPEDFESIILARDRGKAGKSAPAAGLFLEDIEYPQEIFL